MVIEIAVDDGLARTLLLNVILGANVDKVSASRPMLAFLGRLTLGTYFVVVKPSLPGVTVTLDAATGRTATVKAAQNLFVLVVNVPGSSELAAVWRIADPILDAPPPLAAVVLTKSL